MSVHYLVLGHAAKDLVPGGTRLGGTVAYAALTARVLGYTPGLVTSYGDDLDLGQLDSIDRVRVPSPVSTTFENVYTPSGRVQYLRDQAAPLSPDAMPPEWHQAPIAHVGPLVGEVAAHMIASLRNPFVGLTLQGWLRQWDGTGRVSLRDWPEAMDALPHAHAAVLSIEDVQGDWAVAERWSKAARVLVITEGAQGCTVFVRGKGARHFLAPRQDEVDPTGAGDVFAAAFFINLYETDDPWASARFANQVASHSVTRAGLDGVPTPEEVGLSRIRAGLPSGGLP